MGGLALFLPPSQEFLSHTPEIVGYSLGTFNFLGRKIMKKVLAGAILAASFAAPAFAWEGQVVACYDKVWVPAKYEYTQKLIMASHTEWEYKNGQMIKVYYPAVYKESKHMVKAGHYVAKKAACK